MKRLSLATKPRAETATERQKRLVMEAWDRLYGADDRAERRKKLWAKEDVNRKARGRL